VQEERVTIYVELLDEGTKCWRPVSVELLYHDTYRIVDVVPEGETWLFQPGQVVRCKEREFTDGYGLTAYELVTVEDLAGSWFEGQSPAEDSAIAALEKVAGHVRSQRKTPPLSAPSTQSKA
jgi:hypothetical protein